MALNILAPRDIIDYINKLFPQERQWTIVDGPWNEVPYVAQILTFEDEMWLPVDTIVGYNETIEYLNILREELELGLYD